MWWHTRRNQISSFGERDESISIGGGVSSFDYWQPRCAHQCSNAGYTMFRGSEKNTGYPLHSPVSPSLPLLCVTVCHHISTGVYQGFGGRLIFKVKSVLTWKMEAVCCLETFCAQEQSARCRNPANIKLHPPCHENFNCSLYQWIFRWFMPVVFDVYK